MTKININDYLICSKDSKKDISTKLVLNKYKTLFFENKKKEIIGSLTHGDIRRGVFELDKTNNLSSLINKNFIFTNHKKLTFYQSVLFKDLSVELIPVLDKKKKLIGLIKNDLEEKLSNLRQKFKKSNIKLSTLQIKSPARISFSGGTFDNSRNISLYGHHFFSSTINYYLSICFRIRKKGVKIIFKNTSFFFKDIRDFMLCKKPQLILLINFFEEFSLDMHFELKINQDWPVGSGLGGSSTLTNSLVILFLKIYGIKRSYKDIISIAYYIERIKSSIKGGWQDFLPPVIGGANLVLMNKDDINYKNISLTKFKNINANFYLIFNKSRKHRNDSIHKNINTKNLSSFNSKELIIFSKKSHNLDNFYTLKIFDSLQNDSNLFFKYFKKQSLKKNNIYQNHLFKELDLINQKLIRNPKKILVSKFVGGGGSSTILIVCNFKIENNLPKISEINLTKYKFKFI